LVAHQVSVAAVCALRGPELLAESRLARATLDAIIAREREKI
jgi:hypothetical protein